MASKMKTRYDIVNGPDKSDFFTSLTFGSLDYRISVSIQVRPGVFNNKSLTVNAAEREDGSGKKWLFKGYVEDLGRTRRASGYYNLQHRSGFIDIE